MYLKWSLTRIYICGWEPAGSHAEGGQAEFGTRVGGWTQ